MNGQNRIQLNWQSTLRAMAKLTPGIALAVGVLGISNPAQGMPQISKGKLAQIERSSRINPPTPLNLRPRTHIPLPTNSRSSNYNRHSRYRDGYNRHHEYGYGHHHDGHHHHHRDRHRQGPVIIINPARSSSYSNYSSQDGYIRIIRK